MTREEKEMLLNKARLAIQISRQHQQAGQRMEAQETLVAALAIIQETLHSDTAALIDLFGEQEIRIKALESTVEDLQKQVSQLAKA
jgi:nucleoid DNA-binding protein